MHANHLRRFLAVTALVIGTGHPARAELRVAAPVVELGTIRAGQKLSQRFVLTNAGSEPVEIVDLVRGCGCLATRLDQRQISPGGESILSIELRTLGQADGPQAWNLQVHYRAGQETKSLGLSLRGTVQNDITVQPAILGLHVTKSVQQEITLTDSRSRPLRVVAAEARAPGVQVVKIERAGKTTKILLRADGVRLEPGRHEGLLTITTDDGDYGQLQVPIVLTKASASSVAVAPEQVVLRPAAGASTASALVRLRTQDDRPVRIAKIEPSDPALVCTWAPGPGNDATVRIEARNLGAATSLQAHVEIHLSSPGRETITVPVPIIRGSE
jgi:hypothetical protein